MLTCIWSLEPGVLWVFTNGSSGCPLYASAVATPDGRESADGKQFIRIVLSNQRAPGAICNSDLVRYTTSVTVPEGVDESNPDALPDATVPESPTAGTVGVAWAAALLIWCQPPRWWRFPVI